MKDYIDYEHIRDSLNKIREFEPVKADKQASEWINHLDDAFKQSDYMRNLFIMLSKEYEQNLDYLSLMREITDLITQKMEFKKFLELVFRILVLKMGATSVSLMLYDSGHERLDMVGFYNLQDGYRYVTKTEHRRSFKLGEGIAGKAADERRTILVENASEEKDFVEIDGIMIGSLVSMPLIYGETLIGVLNLSHPEIEIFNQQHKNVLNIIASVICIHYLLNKLLRRSIP